MLSRITKNQNINALLLCVAGTALNLLLGSVANALGLSFYFDTIRRKNGRIILKTRNLGIELENITTPTDPAGKVYVALSGDQVALTDIRVSSR